MSKNSQRPLATLRGICILAGSLGSVIPGFTFFTHLAPPLLEEVTLVAALAAAVIVVTLSWPPKVHRPSLRRQKRALLGNLAVIILSFVLAVMYVVTFQLTTQSPPASLINDAPPCQTGFDLAWLTPEAQQWIESNPNRTTRYELMMAFSVFAECRSELIWQSWSIYAAGTVLLLLFTAASLLWAFGFSRLARLLAPRDLHRTRGRGKFAPLFVLPIWLALDSCAPPHLESWHATTEERIHNLKKKVAELDARNQGQDRTADSEGHTKEGKK